MAVNATPSVNLMPAMTIGKRFSPFSRRQAFDGAITSLKTINRAVFCGRAPFVLTVRCRTVAKTLSMGFQVRKWFQCLAGKSKKAQERVTVFSQAFDGLEIFGAVLLGEDRDGRFCARPFRRDLHLAPVRLHVRLNRLRDPIEDVEEHVLPASLVARSGENLLERFPEAERSVADRDLGRGDTACFQVNEQFAPALRTLADTDLEADEFFLAFGRGADDDEHASGIILIRA